MIDVVYSKATDLVVVHMDADTAQKISDCLSGQGFIPEAIDLEQKIDAKLAHRG